MDKRLQDLPLVTACPFSQGAYAKCYEYLGLRGVKTPQEIDRLGIRILAAADIGKGGDSRAALVFPHYDRGGAELDWWSARLVDVEESKPRGFAGMVPQHKGKMFCPPRVPPQVYFPRTIDWTNIAEGAAVYIHESCMKAIAGVRCSTYSLGLNGVWGWGSKNHEIALLSELRDIPWKARSLKCVVVFDSNAAGNDQVELAIARFAERMNLICKVDVQHHLLPKPPEELGLVDWGFDDYCAHYGDEAAEAWLEGGVDAPVVEVSGLLMAQLELNDEVCVVRSLKKVVEQRTGTQMGRGEFIEVNYAHMQVWVDDKVVSAPRTWLQWDGRRVVEKMEYTPGGPRLNGVQSLNTWNSMGVEPMEGDVTPWLSLMSRVIPDVELRKWVIQWFAYPLQNLGAKMNTFIHMFGPPGGGKDAIVAPIHGIYGENAVALGRERIISDFNEVYACKQFLQLDELHSGGDRDGLAVTNKIKMLTTRPRLTVNAKGKSEYEVVNHVNLVTSSNYSDSIKLDENDRRCLVLRVGRHETVIRDKGYWDGYFQWALSDAGRSALYGYLLGVDCSDFYAAGWAPVTEDKEMVTDATRHPMDKWARSLREDPDSVLPPILRGAKVLTAEQAAFAYVSDDPAGKISPGMKNALGQKLRDAGLVLERVKVDGINRRVWIVVNDGMYLPSGCLDTDAVRAELHKHKGKL